jgi:hypothetical protein
MDDWADFVLVDSGAGGLAAAITEVASLPKAFTNAKDFNTVVGMFLNGFKHKIKGNHANAHRKCSFLQAVFIP